MKLSTVWIVRDPWPLCRFDDVCFSVWWEWLTTTVLPLDSCCVYTEKAEAIVDAKARLADMHTEPLSLDVLASWVSHAVTYCDRSQPWCVAGEVSHGHVCVVVAGDFFDNDIGRAVTWLVGRLPPGLRVDIRRSRMAL